AKTLATEKAKGKRPLTIQGEDTPQSNKRSNILTNTLQRMKNNKLELQREKMELKREGT
ncbi:hypothetical protein HK102_008660, partial [Quaeritorhiza haematococci]